MSLFSALSVSASGMSAQRIRSEVLVENMANAETTRTPEGGPYRRKDVVFSSAPQYSPFASVFDQEVAAALGEKSAMTGVEVSDVLVDQSTPEKRFLPGHPDADEKGYVAFPKMNPAEEMVDLMGASRGYQANVSAIVAIRDMINRSLDLLK